MWNRLRQWIERGYPAAFLLGLVFLVGYRADQEAALDFATRNRDWRLAAMHEGTRPLTLERYDHVSELLGSAVQTNGDSTSALRWVLLAALLGYLLLARESWRFRLGVLGLVFAAALSQVFIYPLY